ncbi:hypothetical protein SLEP1_g51546 [Rubroshorea leprosula]|uniref:Uncharacterized protein n=1 Tax=Rubroshorea leprosula TaxID=152421 RepID=A0AAV5M760_9ROSI|nr:hypothetical protein SLEP1_g51546 [Rubroshorea leprosula]
MRLKSFCSPESSLPEPASSPLACCTRACALLHPTAPPVCTAVPPYLLQSPVSCLLRQSRASALLLATALSLPHVQKKKAPDKIGIIFVLCFCCRDQ